MNSLSPIFARALAAGLAVNGLRAAQSYTVVDTGQTNCYNASGVIASPSAGVPDWWRRQYFGGSGTTTNASSCATCDASGNGQNNFYNYQADLNPTNPAARFIIAGITTNNNYVQLVWIGGSNAWQYLECSPTLTSGQWSAVFRNVPPTPVTNTLISASSAAATNLFYRIRAHR